MKRRGKSIPRRMHFGSSSQTEVVTSSGGGSSSGSSSDAVTLSGYTADEFEMNLGTPEDDDYVLSGGTDGTRTWVNPLSITLKGFSVGGGGTVTSVDSILTALQKFEFRGALNDAKVSFPGFGATAGTACEGDDGRLSDARTPLSHQHASSDLSDSTTAGKALLTAADAAAQRTSLGLGSASTHDSSEYAAPNADTTGSAGSLKSPSTTGLFQATGMTAGATRVKTFRDANDTVLEQGGSYSPSGTWTFTNSTVATALGGGALNLSGSLTVAVSSAETSGFTYGAYIVHTVNPASTSSASNHGLRVESAIPAGCAQTIANNRAIVGAASHAGSGLLASGSGIASALVLSGSGGATIAYGNIASITVSGSGPLHEGYGMRGGMSVNNATTDSNTLLSGCDFYMDIAKARNLTAVVGISMSGVSIVGASTCPNVYGLRFGNVNASSTTPATGAWMLKTGNVTGASGTNRQQDLGTGTSLFNDTTDATSYTSESSIHTKGGLAVEKSARFGGPVVYRPYLVSTAPSPSVYSGGNINVSDEVGGFTPAFSDGTNWRRYADRAVISA